MASLIFTHHAERRFMERGIREDVIDLVEKWGEAKSEGNTTRIHLSKRAVKQVVNDLRGIIRQMEHAAGVTVIRGEEAIVTGYRKR